MFDEEKLAQLVRQAWADKALRANLLDDPTSYIRNGGIKVPEGLEASLQVDKDTISLRFEPQRAADGQPELSETALNNVVAVASTHVGVVAITRVDDVRTGKPTGHAHTGILEGAFQPCVAVADPQELGVATRERTGNFREQLGIFLDTNAAATPHWRH